MNPAKSRSRPSWIEIIAIAAVIAVVSPAMAEASTRFDWNGWFRFATHTLDGFALERSAISYAGMQGELQGRLRLRPGIEVFTAVVQRGASSYDQTLTGEIPTMFGPRGNLSGTEWLPRVDQLAVRYRRPNGLWLSVGLFKPPQPLAVAASSKFANYGLAAGGKWRRLNASFRWERPDFNNRWRIGAKPPGEKFFRFDHTRADFYQLDLDVDLRWLRLSFSASVLDDRTGGDDRVTAFGIPIDRDRLGIVAAVAAWKSRRFDLQVEGARNLGRASGPERAFEHRGWMGHASGRWVNGWVNPGYRWLHATGMKMTHEEYFSGNVDYDVNEAFSVYSPANLTLFDTRYPSFIGPFILTGSGYALNYGVPRPTLFGDPHLPENLHAESFTLDVTRAQHTFIQLSYWWRLRSETTPIGWRGLGPVDLPRDLGRELDLYIETRLSPQCTLNVLASTFIPGDYYDAEREDSDPYGLFPDIGDQLAGRVYQVELGIEWSR